MKLILESMKNNNKYLCLKSVKAIYVITLILSK